MSKGITVRHGASVAHAASIQEAAELMIKLNLASPSASGPAEPGEAEPLLQQAQRAASRAHALLLRAFPDLDGAATESLGTALRVRRVRDKLRYEEHRRGGP